MSNVTIQTAESSDFLAWLSDFAKAGSIELGANDPTFAQYNNADGDMIELKGTGLSYISSPVFGTFPSGGTVTSVVLTRAEGDKVAFDGFSESLANVAKAAAKSGDALVALFGNVTFTGNAGNDDATLAGGNDTLNGGGGSDMLDGGDGTDTAVFAGAKGSYTFAKLADGSLTVTSGAETDTLKNIEKVTFSDGTVDTTDLVVATPVNEAPVFTSFGGKTSAKVSVPENKTAVAELLASDKNGDTLTWTLDGKDKKFFSLASSGQLSFKTAPDFETPKDNGKNNVYDVTVKVTDGTLSASQSLAVKVTDVKGITRSGSDKPNTLVGTVEADTLKGKGGNDKLKGGAGDDKLTGGAGADKLYGGDGKVGLGRDTFIFAKTSESTVDAKGQDTIFDFAHGDKIDLSAIDANGKGRGSTAFSFIGDDDFHGKRGELRFEKLKSDTFIHADTDGDGHANMTIHLDDAVKLAKGDFVL